MTEERTKHESLAEALLEAQAEYPPIPKDKHVDFTTKTGFRVKYEYAELKSIRDIIDPVLRKHGLVINCKGHCEGRDPFVVLGMKHVDSQDLETSLLPLPDGGGDMKVMAGNITMLMRYMYCMMTGVVAESDNDAQQASRGDRSAPQRRPAQKNPPKQREFESQAPANTKSLKEMSLGELKTAVMDAEKVKDLVGNARAEMRQKYLDTPMMSDETEKLIAYHTALVNLEA